MTWLSSGYGSQHHIETTSFFSGFFLTVWAPALHLFWMNVVSSYGKTLGVIFYICIYDRSVVLVLVLRLHDCLEGDNKMFVFL